MGSVGLPAESHSILCHAHTLQAVLRLHNLVAPLKALTCYIGVIPEYAMAAGSKIHHPEFEHIDEIVWEALNQYGRTISEIRNESKKAHRSDNPEHKDTMNNPIWHTKPEVDEYVERSLKVKLSDYGPKTRNNALYNEIVNSIGRLRRSGALIDWQKNRNFGAGVWRLDKTKFEKFVRKMAKNQMTKRDFYCTGMLHMISARQKQQMFREELFKEYRTCALCKFRLGDYLIGAHIVPYNVMRIKEPANSMNPANGLLLCRFCDIAFEKGTIMIGSDYYIDISESLKSSNERMINAWLKPIPKKLMIKRNAKYPPERRFLEWKADLLQNCA